MFQTPHVSTRSGGDSDAKLAAVETLDAGFEAMRGCRAWPPHAANRSGEALPNAVGIILMPRMAAHLAAIRRATRPGAIERTSDAQDAAVQNVCVDHRRAHVGVTKQFLGCAKPHSVQ
jgi:hypothetical protein